MILLGIVLGVSASLMGQSEPVRVNGFIFEPDSLGARPDSFAILRFTKGVRFLDSLKGGKLDSVSAQISRIDYGRKLKYNYRDPFDPYNNQADYEVDILDYKVKPESHDVIIALGSINFNSKDEIEARFSHCVNLLKKGGKFYLRANPGITHKTGPYVEIFHWTFEVVNEFAEKYNLKLETFKKDANDRLYFVYTKL